MFKILNMFQINEIIVGVMVGLVGIHLWKGQCPIKKRKTIIISTEGNIGSGKSTLEKEMKARLGIPVVHVREPVDDWTKIKNKDGTTMLELFYGDPTKYGFSFQIMAYISRLKLLMDAIKNNPGAIIMTERSLFTDKLVFAKMLYDTGNIEDVNYQIYLNWFDAFIKECPVHKLIYIKTTPETCYQRINERARDGEEKISLKYLTDCDHYHEQMMEEMKSIPKLVLDGNIDMKETPDKMENWLAQIREFIQEEI